MVYMLITYRVRLTKGVSQGDQLRRSEYGQRLCSLLRNWRAFREEAESLLLFSVKEIARPILQQQQRLIA